MLFSTTIADNIAQGSTVRDDEAIRRAARLAHAAEFIELRNTGTVAANLAEFSVQLVNGSNDSIYNTFNLPAGTLAVGEYYVICGDASNTPRCCRLWKKPSSATPLGTLPSRP